MFDPLMIFDGKPLWHYHFSCSVFFFLRFCFAFHFFCCVFVSTRPWYPTLASIWVYVSGNQGQIKAERKWNEGIFPGFLFFVCLRCAKMRNFFLQLFCMDAFVCFSTILASVGSLPVVFLLKTNGKVYISFHLTVKDAHEHDEMQWRAPPPTLSSMEKKQRAVWMRYWGTRRDTLQWSKPLHGLFFFAAQGT